MDSDVISVRHVLTFELERVKKRGRERERGGGRERVWHLGLPKLSRERPLMPWRPQVLVGWEGAGVGGG